MNSETINFHFIYLNPEFDQQIADDFWDGDESEDNARVLWEDEFSVNVQDGNVKIKNKAVYDLRIQKGEDDIVTFEIPNMTVIQMMSAEGEAIALGASSKMIKKTEKKQEEDGLHFYFYLKGKEAPVSPFVGLYVTPKDFPSMEEEEVAE